MEEYGDGHKLVENDYESEVKLAEYNIVPRPQELIQSQLKASSKSKGKSVLREALLKKEPRKSKEKLSKGRSEKSKDARKSIAKARSVLSSSRMSKGSDLAATSRELTKSFESHLQEAKKSLSRYRYNKSDVSKPTNEDSDKHGYRSSLPAVDYSNQEQQLLKTMGEPAFTAQERYDVLNARDTYTRLREAKKGESKSKIINGTCPDMCPEKERYSRIAKNCLAVFEMKKGLEPMSNSKEVNHSYMIKEYSRSSADQQEPLPHELRPVAVLNFTMDFLICNIIDKIENSISVADWYDFIWNRTRSIRKDITQQQLCDVESVEILEKCARFHILCAEALSEEDAATFDPKINNENLTKCLQTLKHMYHDLQTKGIQCPNEAEFRAYDILLSLTEGETLRLVKDIRKEVFKSPLVKSAFEAALALKSNNYVKFFKLIENATYLSSCIMHRYIHEARVRAVQVIIRAYSLQNNPTVLPLSSLVKDLKFKNNVDAANFCQWYGLTVDETHVTIQRQAFQKPSDAYPIARVASLVQEKMKTGLGVIVNNGPLPENPLSWYQPQDSFDEKGILLQEKISPTFEAADSSSAKQLEDCDDDMEFENTPLTLPSEPWIAPSQESLPISSTAMKASEIVECELTDFKVKTFENFIGKTQKAKSDSFNFFSGDALKLNSNVLKADLRKERFPSARIPKTTSARETIVPKQTFFSSVERFHTSESASPLVKSKNFQTSGFKSPKTPGFKSPKTPGFKSPKTSDYKSPMTHGLMSPKTSGFKSPFSSGTIVNVKIPLMLLESKTIFENKSKSLFAQTTTQDRTLYVQKLKTTNDRKADILSKSVMETSDALEESEPATSESEDEFMDTIGNTNFVQQLGIQQNLHNHDLHGQKSETEWINSVQLQKTDVAEKETCSEGETDFESGDCKEDTQSTLDKDLKSLLFPEGVNDDENSHMSLINEETLKRIREEKICELILDVEDEVYSKCIEELSTSICKDMVDEWWNIKNDVDAYMEKTRLNLARKALYKWKLFCERKRQRNIYKNSEPLSPWLPMLMNTQYVTSGATSPFTVYKKHCSLSRLADSKLKERETKPGSEPLQASNFELLIDQSPLPPAYLQSTGIVRFFKLGLVFASYPDDSISDFVEWMCKKFKLPTLSQSKMNSEKLTSFYTLNGGRTVICIRAVVLGPENISDCNGFMEGMSAMILCCPTKFPELTTFKAFLDKFSTLLKEASLLSTFPLFTFSLETKQKASVLNQTASFLDEKLLSDSCFSTVKMIQLQDPSSFTSNSGEVAKAIKWLLGNQEPVPVLLSASLQNYLEDSFTSVFNTLFWKISLQEFKPLLMLPQHTITFYNEMLDFRANLLCSEYLMAVSESWPPQELFILQPEFRTVNKLFQTKAVNLIKSLHLPEFTGNPSCLEDLWCYVRKTGGLSGNNAMLFISVQTILQSHTYIDWPTIISKCAYHILCGNCSNIMNDLKNNVYYMKEDLDSIDFEPFWESILLTLKEQHLEGKKRKVSESLEFSEKRIKESEQEESNSTLKNFSDFGNISIISNIPDTTSCYVEDMLSSLKSALKKQNEESDKFLLKLNESVSGTFAENDQPKQTGDQDLSSNELFVVTPDKAHNTESLLSESVRPKTGLLASPGANTWEKFVGKKTSVEILTPASISEKLAELRYNIQRNNILEDNLSLLLDL